MSRQPNAAAEPSTSHGPEHLGCPTCDPDGARAARHRPGVSVMRVQARGEEFTVVQVVGNLFVCSRANGSCCCGWTEKGRMPFDNALWSDEWERRRLRNRVHLTFVGCLGPCVVGNNALLQLFGRSVWFKDLNDEALARKVFDYIEASLAVGTLAPVTDDLRGHLYERYLTPADAQPLMTFGLADDLDVAYRDRAADPFAGLDPVCLMEVDVETARFTLEHDGRTYGFCGPGCRREFLEDPAAYLGVGSR